MITSSENSKGVLNYIFYKKTQLQLQLNYSKSSEVVKVMIVLRHCV